MIKKITFSFFLLVTVLSFMSNTKLVSAQADLCSISPTSCYCDNSCNTNADCWNAADCWCNTDPNACSGTEPSCFPAGTPITLENGQKKNIEDIKVGDSVLSQNENGVKSSSTVKELIQPVSNNMCQIDFESSPSLKVTNSHPLLTTSGWKAIDVESAKLEKESVAVTKLNVGDRIINEKGDSLVTSIDCWSDTIQTYNLTVDNNHTYFANGYLAHNKGGGTSCTPATNCLPNWTPAFNQEPIKVRSCDQSDPPVCSLGTAQKYLGCCTAGKTDENGEWYCGSWKYATYPCCPPGTSDQCVIENTGNTYVIEQTYSFRETCSESIDVFVKYEQGRLDQTLRMCDGEWVWNPILGRDKCSGSIYYYSTYFYNTTCQDFVKTCSCSPTCTAVAPSKPSLLSPADNSSITATTVNLVWDDIVQDWGTSCVTNSNTYEVYVGTSPTSLALLGAVSDGNGNSVQFGAGVAGQTYYWKVRAKNGSLLTDSDIWSFTINDGPWWQVKDGDITTNNDLTSSVPDGELFEIVGLGGFPGVPVFGSTFSLTTEPTKISDTLWNINTTTFQSRIFNYAYFKNLIPEDVNFNDISNLTTGGSTYTDGYEWYKVTGDVTTVGDIDLGSRKVILFIESGNLNVEGNINLTDGSGFFGAFVNGNITISDQVTGTPSIEGIYLSDGVFSTGTSGLGDNQLHIRGSVATFGGINLERDLTSNANPAELFEFAPDQMMLFPEKLMYRRSKWQEIAP